MVETTRKHERIPQKEFSGLKASIQHLLPKPVEILIPRKSFSAKEPDLLIHFLGASFVVENATEDYHGRLVAAVVNLGSGSKVFNDAFEDSSIFMSLIDSIKAATESVLHRTIRFRKVILSSFSAGYGAIRRIMTPRKNYDKVDAVLLLDGIHASYIPERKPIAEGGILDSAHLELFLKLAKDASQKRSRKQFMITHSEIFPGTFVSTTEATSHILQNLGIERTPVLRWGPLGMQQLSEAKRNHFVVMGFAGNSAPDHVDHLNALSHFLKFLAKL